MGEREGVRPAVGSAGLGCSTGTKPVNPRLRRSARSNKTFIVPHEFAAVSVAVLGVGQKSGGRSFAGLVRGAGCFPPA
jgi:hypothetical protein